MSTQIATLKEKALAQRQKSKPIEELIKKSVNDITIF